MIPLPVAKLLVSCFCVFMLECNFCQAYRILGICPSASYSHQQPFQALMKTLAVRHNITVISPAPQKKPVQNYEDIDLSFSYRRADCTGFRHYSPFTLLRKNMKDSNKLCEEQLLSDPIKNLISRNLTFDAIIIEHLWFQCYYSLVHHYNFPPVIGFLSVGNLPYVMDSVGNPDDPLLNPDMAFAFNERMTPTQQIWNFFYTLWSRLYFKSYHLPEAEAIARKLIPNTSVLSIQNNLSLIILGNNHVLGYSKPILPNVIEVHSLHISDKPTPLPVELQEFLDKSTNGAIYFSLGSNLQTRQLESHVQTLICKTLDSLNQRVIWKHDGEPPFNSSNIKFVKWAPQQAILAHPNTKLYIMQGGLQSLQEAVHYQVPVIAVPFFGDQNFNARKILDYEIGLTLDIDNLTEENMRSTINKVLDNKIYKLNIKKLSAILNDEQVKPMDRAVWNIEHLMKFPNASHYKYRGREISYFQYYTVLLIIFIMIGAFLFVVTNTVLLFCQNRPLFLLLLVGLIWVYHA